jgi:hypothetical protein
MLAHKLTIFGAVRNRAPYFLLIALCCLWVLPASAAPKTDTVYFKNGDKLTGEVKSLKRGRLSLNTDATGTITIEWDKIAGVISSQQIQVETTSGIRYFGNLTSSKEDPSVIVVTKNGPQTLDPERVIIMSPIEDRGIHALDVDMSLGYNFAKAGGIESGNFGLNMDYRSLIRIESLSFSTTLSDSDTQEASQRTNFSLQHTRLWNNRWFSNGTLTFDKNDELNLNLRSSLGAGVGRFLVQSNSMLWSIDAGLQFARENLTTNDEDVDSLETLFTVKWDWFLFQNPELDWASTVQIIPSLTESGRVRGEVDTGLKWEIIGDLNWGFSFYGTFDNQSQSDTTDSTSDYGFNTSVTYEF